MAVRPRACPSRSETGGTKRGSPKRTRELWGFPKGDGEGKDPERDRAAARQGDHAVVDEVSLKEIKKESI